VIEGAGPYLDQYLPRARLGIGHVGVLQDVYVAVFKEAKGFQGISPSWSMDLFRNNFTFKPVSCVKALRECDVVSKQRLCSNYTPKAKCVKSTLDGQSGF
jgi:hypothetical protein